MLLNLSTYQRLKKKETEENKNLDKMGRLHGTNHGKEGEKSARNEYYGKGQGQVQKIAAHTRHLEGKKRQKRGRRRILLNNITREIHSFFIKRVTVKQTVSTHKYKVSEREREREREREIVCVCVCARALMEECDSFPILYCIGKLHCRVMCTYKQMSRKNVGVCYVFFVA